MNWERFGLWVREMDAIPQGYGIAWYSPLSRRAWCMRVPFHRLAGGFRAFYLHWQRPCENDPVFAAYTNGERIGFARGNDHGFQHGVTLTLQLFREEMQGKDQT